jgi:hypothetical protein
MPMVLSPCWCSGASVLLRTDNPTVTIIVWKMGIPMQRAPSAISLRVWAEMNNAHSVEATISVVLPRVTFTRVAFSSLRYAPILHRPRSSGYRLAAAKIEALVGQPSFVQPQLFHW